MRDHFPAFLGKNSRRSRRISRGGSLQRKGERISRVVPPFQESPRCLSPFQRNLISLHCLDIEAEDPHTPRWHVGQPRGKALRESLMGKPRGKASRKSHISLDPHEGKRETAATPREESACAGPTSSQGLTPLWRLQKYPTVHVSIGEESSGSDQTPHKVLGPRIDGIGIPRGPLATHLGNGLS